MGRCRSCGQEWGAGVHRCPSDGTPLVSDSAATTPAPFALALAVRASTLGDLEPGTMVGEYRIEGKIGEGGMGTVYGAVHPLIRKRAAVKVISAMLSTNLDSVERFVQEARAVNEIDHPNIVDVFALGALPDGRHWLAMEWLQGEPLGRRLERGRLSLDEACLVLEQIADALQFAHGKGVIHRDLKPDNVFLVEVPGGRMTVKLLDFGLAKLSARDERVERTRSGTMMGTPLYVSPEQAKGKAVDGRTDIYALGALGYELLSGKPPFDADNASEIIAMHLTEPPPAAATLPREVPRPLREIIVAMLAKDADDRPPLAELQRVIAGLRGTSTTGIRVTQPHRRWPLIAAAGVAVLLLGGVALGLGAVPFGSDQASTADPEPAAAAPDEPPAPAAAAPVIPTAPLIAPPAAPPVPAVTTETIPAAKDPPPRSKTRKARRKRRGGNPRVNDDHVLENPWDQPKR